MKLLLHVCCAPCSEAVLEGLFPEGIRPELFWYNPNIHPYTEYRARRDSLFALARDEGLGLIQKDEYGLREFIAALYAGESPGTGEDQRCGLCYRSRLEAAARFAAEKGYAAFSTTLLTSPYQKHDLIRRIALECAVRYGVEFFYRDFRPWFRRGQRKARERGRYAQKYCGCVFSEEERYLGKVSPRTE